MEKNTAIQMERELKQYDIVFSGLKVGKHTYDYHIDQSLIDHFAYQDNWTDAQVEAHVELNKLHNHMELAVECQGSILVPCDATGEEFRLTIEGKSQLLIKFGSEPMDDDDILIISPIDHKFNIADILYQTVVLSVPMKRYCPSYLEREEDEDNASDDQDDADIDPRWSKLKDILTN